MDRLGEIVKDWQPAGRDFGPLAGNHVQLEPLAPRHAAALQAAFAEDPGTWDYLPYGPFPDAGAYVDWIAGATAVGDPLFYALIDGARGQPAGVASYLRINPEAGSVEVGHIALAPALRQAGRPPRRWR